MIQGTRAMRNGITPLAVALACAGTAAAVPPIVTQWKMNTTGATGYGGPDQVAAALDLWGLNAFEVPAPPFMELMKEQVLVRRTQIDPWLSAAAGHRLRRTCERRALYTNAPRRRRRRCSIWAVRRR